MCENSFSILDEDDESFDEENESMDEDCLEVKTGPTRELLLHEIDTLKNVADIKNESMQMLNEKIERLEDKNRRLEEEIKLIGKSAIEREDEYIIIVESPC